MSPTTWSPKTWHGVCIRGEKPGEAMSWTLLAAAALAADAPSAYGPTSTTVSAVPELRGASAFARFEMASTDQTDAPELLTYLVPPPEAGVLGALSIGASYMFSTTAIATGTLAALTYLGDEDGLASVFVGLGAAVIGVPSAVIASALVVVPALSYALEHGTPLPILGMLSAGVAMASAVGALYALLSLNQSGGDTAFLLAGLGATLLPAVSGGLAIAGAVVHSRTAWHPQRAASVQLGVVPTRQGAQALLQIRF